MVSGPVPADGGFPAMTILARIDLDRPTPSRVWTALPPEVKELAARAMYSRDQDDRRVEADMALATQLRFRPTAIRRLPIDKRVGYLARQVRPDDSLAGSLLMALHLDHRVEVLAAFLDALEIPHEGGMISDDFDLEPVAEDRLRAATAQLLKRLDVDEVEIYLLTLVALDPDTWGELAGVLRERAGA
jgi:hypothetical protein